MPKIIQCKKANKAKISVRVRVIRSPLVDSNILRSIISERAKAVIL